ncbi:MAG: TauD/TfdA family dioxygenase [Actinomycetota bacterium]
MTAAAESGHAAGEDITTYNPFEGNRLGIGGMPGVMAARIEDRVVVVDFADWTARRFHHQWLRHCCYCPLCGNAADGIRFHTVASFDRDLRPARVETPGGDLVVTWPDGHLSAYGADWLIHNSYERVDRDRRSAWRPTLWKAELTDDFPSIDWSEATDGGAGHLRALTMLRDYGLLRIAGIGLDPGRTEALAALLGPIHETSVYSRIFEVRTEAVSKLGSKTAMAQAPHTDDAFYYSQPGIVVFHMLANTTVGGTSTYVDGFAVAESLRTEAPEAFATLTALPIDHIRRHPGEIDTRSRGPLISLDERGQVSGIRYFDRALAPLDVDHDDMDRLYDAVREYNRRVIDPAFTATIQIPAGDGMFIDNHRAHHGRTAFEPTEPRRIRTCHVPRDEFHGRLRELSRRFHPETHDLALPQGSRPT